MRQTLALLACAMMAYQLPAQDVAEAEPRTEWETDRDSFTPSVFTAGRSTWILESAYSFIDNRRSPAGHSYPELLIRYGLTERIEARFGWNLEQGGGNGGISNSSSGTDSFEIGPAETALSYGLKFALTEQDGWRPTTALILAGFTPTSGEATATKFVGTLVAGYELPNRWRLDGAFRFASASEHGDRFEEWSPSIVLKMPLAERWNAHIEYFAISSRNFERNFNVQYISPGLHWLVRENIEIGTRVGWGLNDRSSTFFANTGLGVRF